jgi:CHAD domain-containing protein
MRARAVKGLDPDAPLRENAARTVRTRLDELRGFAPAALDPEASGAQHDMRIAAKRLRYVLEVTGGCFGEEAGAARDAAKAIQSLLGEVHDCDVMLPRAVGIESLSVHLRERRALLFECFLKRWQLEASAGTWARLEAAL